MPDLHASLAAYMQKSDQESRFVYALDKIEPILHIYLDQGRTWKEKNITLDMLYQAKKDKVAFSIGTNLL